MFVLLPVQPIPQVRQIPTSVKNLSRLYETKKVLDESEQPVSGLIRRARATCTVGAYARVKSSIQVRPGFTSFEMLLSC